MASALSIFFARRPDSVIRGAVGMHCCLRYNHSQSLWEELLGRKLDSSAAKKLEDAFLEYRVRKAVPSWLPFFPNCSFWIPSTEETIKNLQILAERIRGSKPAHKQRANGSKAAVESSGTITKVAQWALIQQTDRLLTKQVDSRSASREALNKQGSLIQVHLEDEVSDDEDSTEEELEIDEKRKPGGTGK